VTKECVAQCLPPTVCDKASGLCVSAFAKKQAAMNGAATPAPPAPAPSQDAAPTCAGLCTPNERCTLKNGMQECVLIGAGAEQPEP
jgi:hypothetical protein